MEAEPQEETVPNDEEKPHEKPWADDAVKVVDKRAADKAAILEIRIAKSEAYRVYDRFEEEEITVLEDGSFLIKLDWIQDDWFWGLLLSFGSAAEIIAPKGAREEMYGRIRKMAALYEAKNK